MTLPDTETSVQSPPAMVTLPVLSGATPLMRRTGMPSSAVMAATASSTLVMPRASSASVGTRETVTTAMSTPSTVSSVTASDTPSPARRTMLPWSRSRTASASTVMLSTPEL